MKNIHLIQTDKPSRLIKMTTDNILRLSKNSGLEPYYSQHIYITSSEEIKEGDWVITYNGLLAKVITEITWHFMNSKKVILTTDQDLIADGVQAIDDEFLEWIVKNPSCEEVEVKNPLIANVSDFGYKIIIPQEEAYDRTYQPIILSDIDKEEPKQETLEEAAFRLYPRLINDPYNPMEDDNKENRDIWIAGAKWQEQRMCSEEEVLELLNRREDYINSEDNIFEYQSINQWFEQFKKK
jgi:hypothetical protein